MRYFIHAGYCLFLKRKIALTVLYFFRYLYVQWLNGNIVVLQLHGKIFTECMLHAFSKTVFESVKFDLFYIVF